MRTVTMIHSWSGSTPYWTRQPSVDIHLSVHLNAFAYRKLWH